MDGTYLGAALTSIFLYLFPFSTYCILRAALAACDAFATYKHRHVIASCVFLLFGSLFFLLLLTPTRHFRFITVGGILWVNVRLCISVVTELQSWNRLCVKSEPLAGPIFHLTTCILCCGATLFWWKLSCISDLWQEAAGSMAAFQAPLMLLVS